MFQVDSIDSLREHLAPYQRKGEVVAFVPTMGNLHAGHLSLVSRAKQLAPLVVTSIFVNPMQFGAGEDFQRYPRTLDADAAALAKCGNQVLFVPSAEEVYSRPLNEMTRIQVPALSEVLCGRFRSGHFDGVCTVVAKLFNMVQPQIACFGEKDYQQLQVIRRMVDDLNLPIRIVGVETQREDDGLAMSSRNQYLSPGERTLAPSLYKILLQMRQSALDDPSQYTTLAEDGHMQLREAGFNPQYLEFRNADTLLPAQAGDSHVRIFAAAYLGDTRLIDNIRV